MKMMRLLPVMVVVAICGVVNAGPRLVKDSDARKADYIFMEALRQRAEGNSDAYYDLLKAAFELNPADKYLAKEEGTRRLLLLGSGEVESFDDNDEALEMIKKYVEAEPTDMSAGMMYANLSKHFGYSEEAVEAWKNLYYKNGEKTTVGMQYVDALIQTLDSGCVATAMNLLDTLEQREGVAPDFSMRRMGVYSQLNDTASIMGEATKLLNAAPKDVAIVSFLGRLYLELGATDSALVLLNRAVELDPTSGAAYYNRAAYYNQIGDSAGYDKEVFQAMRLPDLELEPKLDILKDYVIKLYRDSTQHERISELFYQLIDQYTHEPDVRNLFADYLVAIGDYAGAAEQKSYELDINPSNEKGWLMLSSLYLQTDDNVNAKDAAIRGIHYFPKEIPLYEIAAASDLSAGNLDSSLGLLNQAVEMADSTDLESLSSILSQIGDVYYKKGDVDSMTYYYEKSIYYNPANLTALNNYAYYLSCTEGADLDKALSMIERVMFSKSTDPTSLDTYAWVLFKRKDYEKARETIDKAIEFSTTDTEDILEHAGDIYFMDGKPEEALKFWERALKLAPDNSLLKKKVKHKTFFYE